MGLPEHRIVARPENALPLIGGARAWAAEGARVGLVTCALCGAAILLDPADRVDPVEVHRLWHLSRGEH